MLVIFSEQGQGNTFLLPLEKPLKLGKGINLKLSKITTFQHSVLTSVDFSSSRSLAEYIYHSPECSLAITHDFLMSLVSKNGTGQI